MFRRKQKERICSEPECKTELSPFNTGTTCSIHTKGGDRMPSKTMMTRVCALESCHKEFQTRNYSRSYCSDLCRMAAFSKRAGRGEGQPPEKTPLLVLLSWAGETAVISIEGILDITNAEDLREARALCEEAASYIVDLTLCPFIDSTGLGILLSLARRTRNSKGQVLIVGAAKKVQLVLSVTGLNKVFELVPTLEEAQEKLASQSPS